MSRDRRVVEAMSSPSGELPSRARSAVTNHKEAENTRDLGLQILRNRMENMSHSMLLKTLKVLSQAGART